MCAIPQPSDEWPCQAMFHEDEESGQLTLMFERDLTQTERAKVRDGISGNSHWADAHTLIVVSLCSD